MTQEIRVSTNKLKELADLEQLLCLFLVSNLDLSHFGSHGNFSIQFRLLLNSDPRPPGRQTSVLAYAARLPSYLRTMMWHMTWFSPALQVTFPPQSIRDIDFTWADPQSKLVGENNTFLKQ